MNYFSRAKNLIVDILFPKKCLNCGREGTYFCEDCFSLVSINPFVHCLCENSQKLPFAGKCPRCEKRKLNGIFAATDFKSRQVKLMVHNFKYKSQIKELCYPLSILILTHFNVVAKDLPGDCVIVPVPLFIKRKKARGFNQAEEIGKTICEAIKIPISIDNLVRIKNTHPQVGLSKEGREENIAGAFAVKNPEELKDKNIFLLDDVYTTGATMEECAKTLKRAGAREVWGVVAARESNK
ncbi:MAG: ComF family protein [Candidatus Paceibacterota bacterium]